MVGLAYSLPVIILCSRNAIEAIVQFQCATAAALLGKVLNAFDRCRQKVLSSSSLCESRRNPSIFRPLGSYGVSKATAE